MNSYIKVLFTKHKKKLPKRLQGTILDEWIRYGILTVISAWMFQGMLYSNWRENVIRLGIDAIITVALTLIMPWWIGLLIAHTLNFTFNMQAKAIFNHMGAGNKPASDFLHGTEAMRQRVEKAKCIDAAIAYGSLSRGCYKPTSDIDVRFVPAKGEWTYWKVCFWLVRERAISFATGYPLDAYVFTLERCKSAMRSDELPIIVMERNNIAKTIYPKRVEWNEWCEVFKKEQGLR